MAATKRTKFKYTTACQWGGDDGYCWAVFIKGEKLPVVSGLTRTEVAYYRERIEKQEAERRQNG